ncbi:MAG: DUF420 domain-containing protein [Myxococcota bacterium]
MNPGLVYWTAALVNLGIVCAMAVFGVRCVRRGEIARHRQAMKLASWLVVAFLLSYVLKVVMIGREDMSRWSTAELWVLRVHELFVLVMLIAGGIAWLQSRRLVATRSVTRDPRDPEAEPDVLRRHKRAGWTAVLSAIAGFALAGVVLGGMYARAASG